ncbi:hypothetical protein LCGC14_2336290 [marine sediment metagenome]|uniref:Uncharacterized protein n=1 Tax=marine sediment metagenome TaxID=412755 RepID=A0A0F9D0V5_9ZZZZ
MTREELLGAVARGWCSKYNEHKTMDTDLAVAIADEVEAELDKIVLSDDDLFERIWQVIKHWDAETSEGDGYHGVTGDDVRVIMAAIAEPAPLPKEVVDSVG